MTTAHEALDKLSEGRQRMQVADFEGAIACFDEVMALGTNPMTIGSAHLNRIDALRKLGRHQEAVAAEATWESQRRTIVQNRTTSDGEGVGAPSSEARIPTVGPEVRPVQREVGKELVGAGTDELTLDRMRSDLRSWGIGLILLAIAQYFVPFLDPLWAFVNGAPLGGAE